MFSALESTGANLIPLCVGEGDTCHKYQFLNHVSFTSRFPLEKYLGRVKWQPSHLHNSVRHSTNCFTKASVTGYYDEGKLTTEP